jgi:hypothetical protein
VTCVNYVRHTPARPLSSAIVRHPKRTVAMLDRLLPHRSVVLNVDGDPYPLRRTTTGTRQHLT